MTNINYIKRVGYINNDLTYNLRIIYFLDEIATEKTYLESSIAFRYAFPVHITDFNWILQDYIYKYVTLSEFTKSKYQYIKFFNF